MDEQVLRAMQRWPNVPAVYGWLRLDRRGRWLLVDRGRPGFDEVRDGGGSPITNEQILEFIARNYQADGDGRWFWQNGPQRVFVDLELAPLILRVIGSGADARLVAHTGEPVTSVEAAWRSSDGELLVLTDLGPAAVHDLDLGSLDFDGDDGDGYPLLLRVMNLELGIEPPDGAVASTVAAHFDAKPRPVRVETG
jgi:hypothetical protein